MGLSRALYLLKSLIDPNSAPPFSFEFPSDLAKSYQQRLPDHPIYDQKFHFGRWVYSHGKNFARQMDQKIAAKKDAFIAGRPEEYRGAWKKLIDSVAQDPGRHVIDAYDRKGEIALRARHLHSIMSEGNHPKSDYLYHETSEGGVPTIHLGLWRHGPEDRLDHFSHSIKDIKPKHVKSQFA